MCRLLLLLLALCSGCAHWNPDAATVAVSVAEMVVDILLGLAQ